SMLQTVTRKLRTSVEKINILGSGLSELHPGRQLVKIRQRVAVNRLHLDNTVHVKLQDTRSRLAATAAALHALSPFAVLGRGFALAMKSDGRLIRDAQTVETGDQVRVRLARGALDCTAINIDTSLE
ncbi:MAG: exodeoxyribonuclease VII large subunit, partial [Pyrinomonadaceae bacterium]